MSHLLLARAATPLAHQVAGHQNVMSDESGELVIKPALPREIAFYQLLNEGRSSPLSRLRPFVPRFYGTLRLEGRLEPGGGVDRGVIPEIAEIPESVVLENLSHAYTRPSILDAKLGRVLHSSDATPEKRARMQRHARETTSWETGLRLTGCQTWHAASSTYILTPKSFGKSITPQQLPQGMVRFFPLPDDAVSSLVPLAVPPSPPPTGSVPTTFPETSSVPAAAVSLAALAPAPEPTGKTGKTMGKDQPAVAMPMTPVSAVDPTGSHASQSAARQPQKLQMAMIAWQALPPSTSADPATAAPPTPLSPNDPSHAQHHPHPHPHPHLHPHSHHHPHTYTAHSLPPRLLHRLLTLLDARLAVLESVLRTLEARFVGASVLVIYEGDPARLEDALDRWDRGEQRRESDFASALDGALGSDEEEDGDEAFEGEAGFPDSDSGSDSESRSDLPSESGSDSRSDSDSDDMDGVKSDARVKRRCPPLTVRMIDFAHTSLAEGEGPDEGVLRGLGTLRGLVRGRMEEVGRWIEVRGGAAG
ncbi:hypothetical protein EHS25_000588 [Saitozyma podzolica]|uniref:Kinase n=1 Tax=Saitozyma podzolica TaxID=1890683 RepID=A0A427YWR9_9TREE|nr:hypothetical protein EHS25_000588 [Saitozyma podzolica]